MAKDYYLKFGSGDPRNYTGLSPTFVIFSLGGLTASISPGVSELPVGSGIYKFFYTPGISYGTEFIADGGAALSAGDRYITGVLDPLQIVDQNLGSVADSFGSTSSDPTSAMGMLKRNLEFNEGNANFIKGTGVWDIYSRGSSTLLREKTLTNTTTAAGKT